MCLALADDARYALGASASATDVGELRDTRVDALRENAYVCGHGALGAAEAVSFERPMQSGAYRVAPVLGRNDLWVEVRVPDGQQGPRWVPPSSVCGRAVPFGHAGLRHRGLAGAVERLLGRPLPAGAWLLIDGEEPQRTGWALVLFAMFAAFALFNVAAIVRLLRRVPPLAPAQGRP
jgi:hypothetical protein